MGRDKQTPEEIAAKLLYVDVVVSQSRKVAEAIRSIEVTDVTYYLWRTEYGALKDDQVKRLKSLDTEN
ncbi:transposase, partial [Methylobacterium sp. J-090]|uniref:transposase n=1 Tax=Methylobacterium sp. J-090 TaxID=2836666 RepID=UPI00391ABA3A|nr:IS3 family transposase [Methylobacterium sp. J-090]